MSSTPPPVPNPLLRVLRHLLMVLGGMLGARAAFLRARWEILPVGDRRRARVAAEIARLVRLQLLVADGALLDDPAFRGRAAEVARMRNDAGRRAMVRRLVHPTRYGLLRSARPAPPRARRVPGGRCTSIMGVA